LVESQIYPLAVYPDEPGDMLNHSFLDRANNALTNFLPAAASFGDCLKVIYAPGERPEHRLEISMDGERALAYFAWAGSESTGVEKKMDGGLKQEMIVL
jgi:hypothetical protein